MECVALPHIAVAVRVAQSHDEPAQSVASPIRGTFGQFEVDDVIGSSSTQEDAYEACVAPAVEKFLQVSHGPALVHDTGCWLHGYCAILL